MRSNQYMQGYSAAWKDAIQWLQERAELKRDEKAKQVLRSAAYKLGARRKTGRTYIFSIAIK